MYENNPILLLRYLKSLINKHLDSYCPTVTVHFWTVTLWALLRVLTISGVLGLQSSELYGVGKIRHEATSSMDENNPVLPLRYLKSLINKHLDSYCPTVTVHFWTVTLWALLRFFTISGVLGMRSSELYGVGKIRHEATSSMDKNNPVLPLRYSKSFINKHLDCYCPFLNCYCLTSPQIFKYIWSYRTPILAKFVALER
jgi:hypothetical protein